MNKIALIFGGPSPEHDVSLFSAKNIYQALKETGLNVLLLGVTHDKKWKLVKGDDLVTTSFQKPLDLNQVGIEVDLINDNGKIFAKSMTSEDKNGPIDVAFPIIHGPFGEDGQLQAILETLKLPYVGSPMDSCILCIDKALTKETIKLTSIQQAPYLIFEDSNPEFSEISSKLGLPFFVKPARMGSSIGIHKVKSEADYHKAMADARIHDKKIVFEKFIKAREIECAALQDGNEVKITVPAEVKPNPNHDFYSYEAKYIDPNGAELVIPAKLDQELVDKIKVTAKEAFKHLKCEDYARIDFFVTEDNQIYLNEINTHPGFTNISLFPQLWNYEGISYKDLILHLLNQALKSSQ